MSTATLFDTETNDRDNPEIIEAAWVILEFGNPTSIQGSDLCPHCEGGRLETLSPCDGGREYYRCQSCHLSFRTAQAYRRVIRQRFKPDRPIALDAMATHHITDEDIEHEAPSCTFELPPCEFLIGHNVDFDAGAAGVMENGPKRIDTCALARHLWPDLDCYSQSALLYHLDRANARERLKSAHSAAADILICKTILDAAIAEINRGDQPVTSWEELWQRSEIARLPVVMAFGKHKGMPIADLPESYRRWLLNATDPPIDIYLRQAITGEKPEARLL